MRSAMNHVSVVANIYPPKMAVKAKYAAKYNGLRANVSNKNPENGRIQRQAIV